MKVHVWIFYQTRGEGIISREKNMFMLKAYNKYLLGHTENML